MPLVRVKGTFALDNQLPCLLVSSGTVVWARHATRIAWLAQTTAAKETNAEGFDEAFSTFDVMPKAW